MLEPLQRSSAPKRRVSVVKNFAAPINGWAVENDFMAAAPNTARILRNIVPRQNSAYVRYGSTLKHNLSQSTRSLYEFDNGAVQQLIAGAGGDLFLVDVEPPSSETSIGTGFESDVWSAVMMSNAADVASLVMVNGEDGIQVWNGTVLTKAVTVPAIDKLETVTTFKNRLWFTEKETASLWYGQPLSNNPTTLTEFPIGPLLRLGGKIVAISSLSMDGGAGPDDYLVAVSSNGEIVVFSGIDPATDMTLVGLFKGARPLSNRCLKKSGSDLVYYGSSGPQRMSELFAAVEGLEGTPIAIRTAFEEAMYDKVPELGWELIAYQRRSWMLFNVVDNFPTVFRQFVLNLETNAWFEITGWNAVCFCVFKGDLYFATHNGKILKADFGFNDDGKPIEFDYMQSWVQFETSAVKKFNQAQITIKSNSVPKIAVDMMVNYREELPKSQPGFAPEVKVSPWDVSPWDTSEWSGSDIFYINTFGLSNLGYVGALRYRGKVDNSTHELYGFRILFEEGEIL